MCVHTLVKMCLCHRSATELQFFSWMCVHVHIPCCRVCMAAVGCSGTRPCLWRLRMCCCWSCCIWISCCWKASCLLPNCCKPQDKRQRVKQLGNSVLNVPKLVKKFIHSYFMLSQFFHDPYGKRYASQNTMSYCKCIVSSTRQKSACNYNLQQQKIQIYKGITLKMSF